MWGDNQAASVSLLAQHVHAVIALRVPDQRSAGLRCTLWSWSQHARSGVHAKTSEQSQGQIIGTFLNDIGNKHFK